MQSKLKKQTTQKYLEVLLQFGIRNGKKVTEGKTGKTNKTSRKHKKVRFFKNKTVRLM